MPTKTLETPTIEIPSPYRATSLWLGIHFPSLPAEIFTRGSNTSLPTVVVQKQRILFRNDQAIAAGITVNSSISTALALSPKLKTFERATSIEREQLHNLAQWVYRFSPSVCLSGQDVILIEISSSIRLFKGLNNILRLISNGLKKLGYSFTMELGHTPKAAELLTRNVHQLSSPPDYLNAPDQHRMLSAIHALPLQALPEQNATATAITKLKKMGLETLGQVLKLPSGALRKRFGNDFYTYLQQLSGARQDPQIFIQTKARFSSQLFFLEPIENTQGLTFPMQRLLDELCHFLHTRQLHCNHLEWVMHQGRSIDKLGGKHVLLKVQLSQAQANKVNFMDLSRIQLEKLTLNQGIHTLALKVRHLLPVSTTTESLFDHTHQGASNEPLDSLLDKLQARLGESSVYCIDCSAEHLPEKAHRHKPVNIREQQTTPYDPENPYRQHTKRPVWLLREPSRIQSRNGGLYWRGRLNLQQGPERIETGWWNQAQQRDYYVAQHVDGGFYWVYQDIVGRQWFLHGFFS